VNEQRRDDRRTAVDGEDEAYTAPDPDGGVDSIVGAVEPGSVTNPTVRHSRRTLVRRALIVSDVWALGLTFMVVHLILGTSSNGFT
jgi:hypothetical protein